MLILSRKPGEKIIINGNIEIIVNDIKGEQVKLAINAPKEIKIYREEIYTEVKLENSKALDTLLLPSMAINSKSNAKNLLE